MKRIIRYSISMLFVMGPLLIQGQISFTAEMAKVQRGNKKVYQVQSNGSMYRYDFDEDGIKGAVIVNPEKKLTAILMPDKKFVHYTEISSSTSRSNDPVQSLMTIRDRYKEKNLGKAKIAGYNCDKSELFADDQKIFTLWFSDELNFPLRIENHLGSDTYMEISGIKEQKINSSVFIIPEEYTEVDDRMRPIIPEPPAPESWNTIKLELPIKGEYSRGDLLSFNIPEEKNYIVSVRNIGESPAKTIRRSLRNGTELSDNEQGPIKYRTKRIFKDESSKDTYSWKKGDTKLIEVHEGKILLEIKAENF